MPFLRDHIGFTGSTDQQSRAVSEGSLLGKTSPDPPEAGSLEKVAWVYVRDGRLLVARNRDREKFYLPGGRQEPGESDPATLLREVAEELSVAIVDATIRLFATVSAGRDGANGSVLMRCYTALHRGQLIPRAEVAEIAWVTAADLDRVTDAEAKVMSRLLAADLLKRG